MLSRPHARRAVRALAVLAVTAITAVAPAGAADINDRSRMGSAYEDPRYADIYSYPSAPSTPRGEYLPPMPRRYLENERRHSQTCASHHEIRRDLTEQGWSEFHDLELRGSSALIEARRPNGQTYQLRIDRCSGEILNAQRLGERPYAWRDRQPVRPYPY